ncbi:hypothetical protein Q8A73_003321 [Channa argus]|nr:hypothetical protein Q8A73_003321 [Channa argus]
MEHMCSITDTVALSLGNLRVQQQVHKENNEHQKDFHDIQTWGENANAKHKAQQASRFPTTASGVRQKERRSLRRRNRRDVRSRKLNVKETATNVMKQNLGFSTEAHEKKETKSPTLRNRGLD